MEGGLKYSAKSSNSTETKIFYLSPEVKSKLKKVLEYKKPISSQKSVATRKSAASTKSAESTKSTASTKSIASEKAKSNQPSLVEKFKSAFKNRKKGFPTPHNHTFHFSPNSTIAKNVQDMYKSKIQQAKSRTYQSNRKIPIKSQANQVSRNNTLSISSNLKEKYKGLLSLMKNKFNQDKNTTTTITKKFPKKTSVKVKTKKKSVKKDKKEKPKKKVPKKSTTKKQATDKLTTKGTTKVTTKGTTKGTKKGTNTKTKVSKRKRPEGWSSFVSRIPEKLEFTKAVQIPGKQETGQIFFIIFLFLV